MSLGCKNCLLVGLGDLEEYRFINFGTEMYDFSRKIEIWFSYQSDINKLLNSTVIYTTSLTRMMGFLHPHHIDV